MVAGMVAVERQAGVARLPPGAGGCGCGGTEWRVSGSGDGGVGEGGGDEGGLRGWAALVLMLSWTGRPWCPSTFMMSGRFSSLSHLLAALSCCLPFFIFLLPPFTISKRMVRQEKLERLRGSGSIVAPSQWAGRQAPRTPRHARPSNPHARTPTQRARRPELDALQVKVAANGHGGHVGGELGDGPWLDLRASRHSTGVGELPHAGGGACEGFPLREGAAGGGVMPWGGVAPWPDPKHASMA